jgi:hypothetical protein
MRVLFLHSNIPNYVSDGLFHGLRSLHEHEVVDVPRHDVMYTDATPEMLKKTGSRGRTLYALLPPETEAIKSARVFWQRELGAYDLIIIADIAQMPAVFAEVYNALGEREARKKLIIVDGYDSPARFPFFNIKYHLKQRPWVFRLPLHKVMYFKREFVSEAGLYGSFAKIWGTGKSVNLHFPISMSIPESCIENIPAMDKTESFVQFNVDPGLKDLFEGGHFAEVGHTNFPFSTNEAYDNHLRKARFGITGKRAGWDCLRHYEYAAKGVILCFKQLDLKPTTCAPFGLDETNCIIYRNQDDLTHQIDAMKNEGYNFLQQNTYAWIKKFTTKEVAMRFINQALKA